LLPFTGDEFLALWKKGEKQLTEYVRFELASSRRNVLRGNRRIAHRMIVRSTTFGNPNKSQLRSRL
jgi:hypothetical protein